MTQDDLDAPEDFEKGPDEKPSLKEVWESSLMLKLGAIVVGVGVLAGGYTLLFAKEEVAADKAKVTIYDPSGAKQVPGSKELDPAYQKALEDANRKSAEQALATGESTLPTPIGTAKKGSLDIPEMPDRPKSDVLAEWRKATANNRMKAAESVIEEESGGGTSSAAPPPEDVPMVQPIRPQMQAVKQDPNAAKRLMEQMRVIIGAQAPGLPKITIITPEDSFYTKMKKEEEAAALASQKTAGTGDYTSREGEYVSGAAMSAKTIVPAGSIAYAQLLTELNSDITGPVLAQVLSGPFTGGRMIGNFVREDEYLVISFKHAVKDAVSYKIDGIALDENTTLAAQASDVDHHYFTRIVLPAAAAFVGGYGAAIAETGSSVEQTAGGSQAQDRPAPSPKESLYKGLEKASGKVSEMLDKQAANKEITVKLTKGTTMGVFFVDTVTTADAEK